MKDSSGKASEGYGRFEKLAKKLVNVPKSRIDEAARRYDERRKAEKRDDT